MKECWKPIQGYEDLYEVSNLGRVRSKDREVEYEQFNGHATYIAKRRFKGQVISPNDNGNGYLQVTLNRNGKSENRYVHRLVAEEFIPNPENLNEVNHKDFDRSNNKASNLEWIEHCDNQAYSSTSGRFNLTEEQRSNISKHKSGSKHHNTDLTEETVKDIKRHLRMKESTQTEIAKKFGVSRSCINHISIGNTWKHVKI